MTKQLASWILVLLAGVGIAATAAPPSQAIVRIANFSFSPATIEVPVGTTVEWVNTDDAPHVVTGVDADSPLESPALDSDDHYATTFDKPGRYRYFCSLHPQMVGTIIVK